MNIEDAAEELLVHQLAIARQSLEERDERIADLNRKVELLETMLNRLAAQRFGVPAPQPQTSARQAPKRWSVR